MRELNGNLAEDTRELLPPPSVASNGRAEVTESTEQVPSGIDERFWLSSCILENMAEGMIATDMQGIIQMTNPAADQLMGYGAHELIGQRITLLSGLSEGETAKVFQEILERLQHQIHWFGEVPQRRKNGEIVIAKVEITRIQHGERVLLVALYEDITQRKRTEAALQASQHQLADAMDLARMANWEYDVAMGLFTFDDRFFRLYGTTADREGGNQMSVETYVREFLFSEDAHIVANGLAKALVTVDPNFAFQVEHRIRRRDGEVRHLMVRVAITKDATGRTVKIRGVNQDITERQRLERQILEISDREQARIGQDLHDGLCQQLVSLAFDANSLHRQLVEKHRPEAATAQRIADFLDQAISEARQLSRGLFPIRLEADGLPSAIEELARSTRERFQLDCHFECAERIVFKGKIVATHLYRIAQEAVNNAVKHARPKHITIRLICHPDTLELRVEDDGLGMTAEVSPGNSGMGLHIMHYRATSIGGTLHVVQNVHGGTLVSCCLPWEQS